MTEGCTGCLTKSADRDKESAIKKAIEYAAEKHIPVAIYKENGEWQQLNAFEAYRLGYPVVQVFSEYY
jgi:hypothetical protein